MAGYGTSAGIGTGIGEGLGSIADAIVRHRDRGRADRDKQAEDLLGQAKAIAANRAQIAAANPQDPKLADLDKQGQDLVGQANGLYQPHEKGQVAQLFSKVFGGGQPKTATPAPGRYNWNAISAASPVQAPPADNMADIRRAYKGTFGRDMTDEEAQKFFAHVYGGAPLEPKPDAPTKFQPQLTETTDAKGVKHYWRISMEAGGKPEEVDFQGQAVTPRTAPHVLKVTGEEQMLKDLYGDKPTPQQRLEVHQKWTGAGADTVGTHIIQVPQPDGSIKSYEVTTTSHKALPNVSGAPASSSSKPAAGGASIPKTPAQARSKMQEIGVTGGKVDANAAKSLKSAKDEYEGAIDRTKVMDRNLTDALAGDQQAMLSLVANHIGMTLGAQKGSRINKAVWEEAIQSTPWLQRMGAKFNSNGYLSGVTLAPEQMRQMVKLAHEKEDVLRQHVDRLNTSGKSSTGVVTDDEILKLAGQAKNGSAPRAASPASPPTAQPNKAAPTVQTPAAKTTTPPSSMIPSDGKIHILENLSTHKQEKWKNVNGVVTKVP